MRGRPRQKLLRQTVSMLNYSQRIGERFQATNRFEQKLTCFRGLLLAVTRVVAHPVNESVEHESVTEQTNGDEGNEMHRRTISSGTNRDYDRRDTAATSDDLRT
jgi:hypothetical protein